MIPIKFHFDCYTQTIINLSHISINDALLENWRVWQVGVLTHYYIPHQNREINPRNICPQPLQLLHLPWPLACQRSTEISASTSENPNDQHFRAGFLVVQSFLRSPALGSLRFDFGLIYSHKVLHEPKTHSFRKCTNKSVTKKHKHKKVGLQHTEPHPHKGLPDSGSCFADAAVARDGKWHHLPGSSGYVASLWWFHTLSKDWWNHSDFEWFTSASYGEIRYFGSMKQA